MLFLSLARFTAISNRVYDKQNNLISLYSTGTHLAVLHIKINHGLNRIHNAVLWRSTTIHLERSTITNICGGTQIMHLGRSTTTHMGWNTTVRLGGTLSYTWGGALLYIWDVILP